MSDLCRRELISAREPSTFEGTREYAFRHAILRDVTYETIVPRQRRALHKQVAEWLVQAGGERASELTLQIAEHFALAGEPSLGKPLGTTTAGWPVRLVASNWFPPA